MLQLRSKSPKTCQWLDLLMTSRLHETVWQVVWIVWRAHKDTVRLICLIIEHRRPSGLWSWPVSRLRLANADRNHRSSALSTSCAHQWATIGPKWAHARLRSDKSPPTRSASRRRTSTESFSPTRRWDFSIINLEPWPRTKGGNDL
jgi:hypothetical protein